MTAAHDDLAARLLDAQVAYTVAQLTGERFAGTAAEIVDSLLGIAGDLVLGDIADVATVQQVVRHIVVEIGGSPVVEDLVPSLADAVYDLGSSGEYTLGEVVDRESVDNLVSALLGMHTLQDRALERIAESPLVGVVASRFVTRIVGDFLQQNRQLAEKLPGMSSLFSIGQSAASRVRGATDKHLETLLGDAAGKSVTFAIRRTNSALRDLIRDAPLQGAVMEVWDLQAAQPMTDLREYLSAAELRELVVLVHRIAMDVRESEYATDVLDACVEVFFERYGEHDLDSLLGELGVGRDDLVDDVVALGTPVLDAMRESSALADIVRARLAPFWESEQARAVLAR